MSRFKTPSVELECDLAGAGPRTLLLVHGTAGDRSHFEPQLRHFSSAHRVLSVDLRGHGSSERPSSGYAISQLAEDLFELCRGLSIERPVLVGHSLGGFIGLELEHRRPGFLGGLAMLDAPILFPAEASGGLQALTEAFHGPAYREALLGFASASFFAPGDDPHRKARILETLAAFPREIFLAIWEECLAFQGESRLRSLRAPALYLHSVVPVDLPRLQSLCPALGVRRTSGAGHYLQLEMPEQVSAMIEGLLSR